MTTITNEQILEAAEKLLPRHVWHSTPEVCSPTFGFFYPLEMAEHKLLVRDRLDDLGIHIERTGCGKLWRATPKVGEVTYHKEKAACCLLAVINQKTQGQ